MSKNVTTFEVDMDIKVLSKTKAKELKGLSSKKERDLKGLFLAEGDKCVRDTLDSFKPEFLIVTRDWLAKNSFVENIYPDNLYLADKKTIALISCLSSLPEVIAVFKKPEDSEEVPELDKHKIYLLLDEIQDPGNLGTIIRTCDWFGVYDIFASRNTVDVYSPKVVQSTMGSLSRVKVHYLDLETLISKNRDIKLVGTVLDGIPIEDYKNIREGMILMGNEGRGISEKLKRYIDIPITIPPVNKVSHPDSLNVAIASAVILSHLR